MQQTLLHLSFACSAICSRLLRLSESFHQRLPSQRKSLERVNVALPLFPLAGNQAGFDELLSGINDGSRCDCGFTG